MRHLKTTIWILSLVLTAASCSAQVGKVKPITNAELRVLMQSRDIQLVDLRTPDETKRGILEGALIMDVLAHDFKSRISTLDRTKPVVIYCAVGGRSASTGPQLLRMGFTEVYELSGGVRQWQMEGYPLVKPKMEAK